MSKEFIEEMAVRLTRIAHPSDQGEPTSTLENELRTALFEAYQQGEKDVLKQIIREYQDNELEGKGYDFYFSIRSKIDDLQTLTQTK